MKKICSLLLSIAILFGTMVPTQLVFAAELDTNDNTGIAPCYSYIVSPHVSVSFSGTTATVSSNVSCVKKYDIIISMTLQRKDGTSWTSVHSWGTTATSTYASLTKTSTGCTSGKQYRTKGVFSVNGETTTIYSTTKTC